MTSADWDAAVVREDLVVLLVAGPSTGISADNIEVALERQDAIVALAEAVVERGVTLAIPANPEIAYLVASVALPHAEGHTAERRRRAAPVVVYETGEPSSLRRQLLAPFAHHNALTYFDREGTMPDMPPVREDRAPDRADKRPDPEIVGLRHEAIAPSLLQLPGLVGAVVIGHTRDMEGELAMLLGALNRPPSLGRPIRVAVFANTSAAGPIAPRSLDPTYRLLNGRGSGSFQDPDDRGPDSAPMPYGYLMERLIDEWLEHG